MHAFLFTDTQTKFTLYIDKQNYRFMLVHGNEITADWRGKRFRYMTANTSDILIYRKGARLMRMLLVNGNLAPIAAWQIPSHYQILTEMPKIILTNAPLVLVNSAELKRVRAHKTINLTYRKRLVARNVI
jgi:hypothetical protein